jgi:hypothetical protein
LAGGAAMPGAILFYQAADTRIRVTTPTRQAQ